LAVEPNRQSTYAECVLRKKTAPSQPEPTGTTLSRFFWAAVIGLGGYLIVASAVASVVGWFN
jgi:hypothetical protein